VADAASFDFRAEWWSSPVPILWRFTRGQLEYSLRSGWNRPEDLDDQSLVAEVEVAVDAKGQIAPTLSGKKVPVKAVGWTRCGRPRQNAEHEPPAARQFPLPLRGSFDVVATEPVGP